MKLATEPVQYQYGHQYEVLSSPRHSRRAMWCVGGLIAGALVSAACSANAGTTISLFTPGTGQEIVSDVTSLEFSDDGAAVISGGGPWGTPFNVGNFYNTRIMTQVTGFGRNGLDVPPTQPRAGLNQAFSAGGYEITMVATLVDMALESSPTHSTSELIGGLIRWYYDDASAGGVQASLQTGAGYDDGAMILEAMIVSGKRVMNAAGAAGTGQFIDLSVVDSILDHGAIRGLSHDLFTNYMRINGDFTYPAGSAGADQYFTGGAAGAYADYRVTDCEADHSTHGQCDLKLRFSASSYFVPEPGSLGLISAMTIALGGAGWRRRGRKDEAVHRQ